jgi:hypothetical protein
MKPDDWGRQPDSPWPWCLTEQDVATFRCRERGHTVAAGPGELPSRKVGPIEQAVEDDLASMAAKVKLGRRALAESARKLARVLDARGDEEPASQTAKAVDTLRITMNQIAAGEEADANVQDQLQQLLGTPSAGGSAVSAEVRYPKEP